MGIDSPSLLLDASCSQIHIGAWQDNQWLAYKSLSAPALESLFTGTDSVLKEAGLTLPDIQSYLFCEGPGSILGIRLAAMAIRTWCVTRTIPVYSYKSLEAAAAIAENNGATYPIKIATESRMKRWNLTVQEVEGSDLLIQELKADGFEEDDHVWYYPQRQNTPPPCKYQFFEYNLEPYPELFSGAIALEETDSPDAFTVTETTFEKWTFERHRKSD